MPLLLLALLAYTLTVLGQQAPRKINCQTVVRDAAAAPVINQNVSLRFSILTGAADGPPVYTETNAATTNVFGLAAVLTGNGRVVSGNFATIGCSGASKFLKIEADMTGRSTYTNLSTVETRSKKQSQCCAGSRLQI